MTSKKKADDAKRPDIQELKAQIAKLTDIAARSQADLQNFKKRQERDAGELAKFAVAPLLLGLLPIRDDLKRAATHDGNSEGCAQILAKLDALFEGAGLKKISSVGERVDPGRHEIIGAAPGEKDVVLEVYEEGYELHGRVFRPAKVIVGDGSTTTIDASIGESTGAPPPPSASQ